VTIDLIGPLGTVTIQALVDTGSDETIFPLSVATSIGVKLDRHSASQASAVGGHTVELIPGAVELRIANDRETFSWHTVAGFLNARELEDEIALLGYAGFLEFFRATFDSSDYEVEITPHERFQAVKF
jgi:hypothetical protein